MEKKKNLGIVTVTVDGKDEMWNLVSMLVTNFKGDRRVAIGKTDHNTYTLTARKPDDNGEVVEHEMHLTREGLAAVMGSIFMFLNEEGEDVGQFTQSWVDDNSGFLYKRVGEED